MLSSFDMQPNASRQVSWSREDLLKEGGNHPNRHTSGTCDFRSEGEATEAGNLRPFATSLDNLIRSAMSCTVLDSWPHCDIFGLKWR